MTEQNRKKNIPWGWIFAGLLFLFIAWNYLSTNYDWSFTPRNSHVPAVAETLSAEQHYPASFVNAGISEVVDPSTGYCALIKSIDGDQMTWGSKGSFWTGSEDMVNARFGKHVEEYLAKYPNCFVYNSVAEFYSRFMQDVKSFNSVDVAEEPFVETVVTNDFETDKVIDNGYRKYRLDADWIGDDFDVEHALPATVVGPANVEVKPFMGQGCFLLRVNEGESFTTDAGGAFWPAGSQGALVERWKHHLAEYLSHYPECTSTYESVAAFLAANPTYR